jgi:hypothetical protein
VTASPMDPDWLPAYQERTLDEILRDENVKTVENIHDLAVDGFFESDEELEEFLRFYHEQRQSGLG